MDRFIEQEKARHLVPTWQDIQVLESVNAALKPPQIFTDALSGEEYVSVSYLKPILNLFNRDTVIPKGIETDLTKEM